MPVLDTELRRTAEQERIISAAVDTKENLILNALAGCGKTSTLEMIERALPRGPILYLVFNKKNADEATERMFSTTTVRTFNSLGHRIWAGACAKRLRLDAKKTHTILREMIDEVKDKGTKNEIWASYWAVIQGVALAKALGYVPEGKYPNAKRLIEQGAFHSALEEKPDDLTSDLIDAVLVRSIKQSYDGCIDYNDQIYMPALFGGTFPNFPLSLVDEAQDLSPVNHAMLHKLVKNRIIAVGDPWQSIYGFRGAKRGGMSEIQSYFQMTPLDLSTSFRCPQAVVEAARWRVPNFNWIKPGGHVETLTRLDPDDIHENSAIICRNNAPLFRTGLQLLGHGRSVSIAGSDIGPKLVGLMRKLGDDDTGKASVLSAIDDWLAERLSRESTTAQDLADCMRVFANAGESLGQAIAYAEHLFKQTGTIQLLTGHKAKGLEFETVYFLDPFLCREEEQDQNLRYVIQTRSMNNLFEIDSRNIEW